MKQGQFAALLGVVFFAGFWAGTFARESIFIDNIVNPAHHRWGRPPDGKPDPR